VQPGRECMKNDHRKDRHGTQAVNIGPVDRMYVVFFRLRVGQVAHGRIKMAKACYFTHSQLGYPNRDLPPKFRLAGDIFETAGKPLRLIWTW
jgi:hypothetical protein